eukprot:Cvel_29720.t1-p1 / transcript=Cvel_29720.t1 / gene=Cvel_29720 / organism=Chromera_velia_CCMP2878 / gene_product=hypothetical protein / transcript_product=hypothetical protein / location=Cvel_scaffold4121:8466-11186(+) / protein_length=382 / sequence_SO=supercontig / SO=protein_coding / is_pseudo=false
MDQIGFGFKGQSRNPNHRALLAERALGDAANWADIATYEATSKAALAAEITNRKIEYATLLDANGMIVVNANSNRTGELWDPAGLVTVMRNHWGLGQIKTTEILPFTDFRRENPPIHRERDDESDPSPPLHPWDTGRDPLIRWMLTPIVSSGSTGDSGGRGHSGWEGRKSAFIVRGLFVERESTRQSFTIIRILEALSRAADILGVLFVFTGALLPVWRAAKPARAYLENREELHRLTNANQGLYKSKRKEEENREKQKKLEEKMRKKKLEGGKIGRGELNLKRAKSPEADNLSGLFDDEEIEQRVKDLRRQVLSDRQQFLKAVCRWRLPSLRTLLMDSLVSVIGLSLMVMTLHLSLELMTANLENQAIDEASMLSIAYMIK